MIPTNSQAERRFLAPCGLYCGNCGSLLQDDECHGCGCRCGQCAAEGHHGACAIHRCVSQKGFVTCAECGQMPCTKLVQFAYDPIWRTHLPVLENLRRIGKIGTDAWLSEQKEYWSDQKRLTRWLALYAECTERYRQQDNQ